jgi:hypothetical protein
MGLWPLAMIASLDESTMSCTPCCTSINFVGGSEAILHQSDNTYEDLDPEDPVMDTAKMVWQEFPGMFHGDGELATSTTSSSSSTLGGLNLTVAELLKSPQIQQALSNLVKQILQYPKFKRTSVG